MSRLLFFDQWCFITVAGLLVYADITGSSTHPNETTPLVCPNITCPANRTIYIPVSVHGCNVIVGSDADMAYTVTHNQFQTTSLRWTTVGSFDRAIHPVLFFRHSELLYLIGSHAHQYKLFTMNPKLGSATLIGELDSLGATRHDLDTCRPSAIVNNGQRPADDDDDLQDHTGDQVLLFLICHDHVLVGNLSLYTGYYTTLHKTPLKMTACSYFATVFQSLCCLVVGLCIGFLLVTRCRFVTHASPSPRVHTD